MTESKLTIRSLGTRAVNVPFARPLRTAAGTIPTAPLALIDVLTDQGIVGRAYIFAYTPVTLAALCRLLDELSPIVAGRPAAPRDIASALQARFRLLGRQGLLGMALSGIDMALWDAQGRALGVPVCRLLGAEPRAIPAYDSFGLVTGEDDLAAIERSVASGFRAIKIKLGDGDLARDAATTAAVRKLIGPEVALMVDYNQTLDAPEAIRRVRRLAEHDLAWVEEPVPAEDLRGHARVREAVTVPVQTGENWWGPIAMYQAVEAGACDLAMPDLMKIGGISGWVEAAGYAAMSGTPVSSHIFIEASAHALAASPTAHYLEYLDKAGPLLREPLAPENGQVAPRGPGLGLDWDEAAVARYRA